MDQQSKNENDVLTLKSLITATANILNSKNPQKCSLVLKENNKNTGTLYLSKDKIFFIKRNQDLDEIFEAHILIKDTNIYIWSDKNPKQGVIMKKELFQSENPNELEDEYIYKCENWLENEKIFELPKNITFINFDDINFGSML